MQVILTAQVSVWAWKRGKWMKKNIMAAFAMMLLVGITSLQGQEAFAKEAKNVTESSGKENEDCRAKMDASIKKWDALTDAQKKEVYEILNEKQTVEEKLLDKMASFGVMEKADVEKIKTHRKQMLSDLQESGEFPMCRRKPHHKAN